MKTDEKSKFVDFVLKALANGEQHNKRSIEKAARSFGINNKTEVKEFTELAIAITARSIARLPLSVKEKYWMIVKLYESQVNLSHRTSQSMLLQQYSTPAPIGYLAGIFVNADQPNVSLFEPSAGNGLLTIASDSNKVVVNEIDRLRNSNLKDQGFKDVLMQDATRPFVSFQKRFDAIITNPPFGMMRQDVKYETFGIRSLEHLMALRALDCMKDNGKAAFIIGGHTRFDKKGRIQKGRFRIFFNYLYSRYNVVDLINIDGHKLYSRQGTSFDTRLILIDGRKVTTSGSAPLADETRDKIVNTFEELYERVMYHVKPINNTSMSNLTLRAKALALKLRLMNLSGIDSNLPVKTAKIGDRYFQHLENYKGFDIVIDFDSSDRLIQIYDHRDNKFYSPAMIKNINGGRVFIARYNTLPNARLFVDWFTAHSLDDLGMPYTPASESCVILDTVVPDSMGHEMQSALQKIKTEIGGDVDEYVRTKLDYKSKTDLCKALAAEQIDAVAMAVYNIEQKGQGIIIGDQTGIGKGRVAAAIIRYGVVQGVQPIFITEKANLFSDIYRDLVAIGSNDLVPFIVNGRESKTDIKDEDGEVVHQALPVNEQERIFSDQKVPARFDFIVGTYSQFNSPEKKPVKPTFLKAIAEDTIMIMDEAHNSSGSSNVGSLMQSVVEKTRGVVFLSATFAKRPDNMPIYAMKTAISEANMTREDLVEAITHGGVALQEILASQLVAEGQMLRRERSFEGVEVNYITLTDKEAEHRAISDNITAILRDIIEFQTKYIDKLVGEMDDIAVAEGKQVDLREGTSQAGVDNLPYFSKVFNVINQMLFSIKAEAVAERAIARLKEGKKPVIAFASTMGSFIEAMEGEGGMGIKEGDVISADFSEVLQRGLDGIFRYTETAPDGTKIYKSISVSDLPIEAQVRYGQITKRIRTISTGISISPIDIIIQKIEGAGYSVAEVTGRKYRLQLNQDLNGLGVITNDNIPPSAKGSKRYSGLVLMRKKVNTNDAFRQFNNNEIDVLLINQSGSTGASAHAIVTPKVPKEQVKQRVMIVLQPELDINTEVQKRGRINRTGQIMKPIYDYVNSAIPAEMRLMMMLQKKLKSLDANTTSNQKSSTKILDVPDFLNKYGDRIVAEYLAENLEIDLLLDKPLGKGETEESIEDASHKVSGRVAVLSTEMQQDFYNEVSQRYNELVEYLKQIDEYDLEVEAMDLQAETTRSRVIKVGNGGSSSFGDNSILETIQANVLRKPFSKTEVLNLITESLKGADALELQKELEQEYNQFVRESLAREIIENEDHYKRAIENIPNEKKVDKLKDRPNEFQDAIQKRTRELQEVKTKSEGSIKKAYDNRQQYLNTILKTFYVGKAVNFPVTTYEGGQELIYAIFIGFIIDRKKKNPYAPSSIRLRFALASSKKYIVIPGNYTKDITAIIGASTQLQQSDLDSMLNTWQQAIEANTVDRKERHVIIGNLLQAFSAFNGKLVSYTTKDGKVKKGILLPESWQPKAEDNKTSVPIERAVKFIRGLTTGNQFIVNKDLSFFRQPDGFRVVVSSSKSRSGDIFLDETLLSLVVGNNFEKLSNSMSANVEEKNIEQFVKALQEKFNLSVWLTPEQFEFIKNDLPSIVKEPVKPKLIDRPPVYLPPTDESKRRQLRLRAAALTLKLKLLQI